MTDMLTSLPTLSLAIQDSDPEAFAQAFGDSFRTFGFAVIADHGVDRALIDKAWEQTRLLFELPEEVKRSYYTSDLAGQRGYTPFGTEIAKDADHVDLKEFWHMGRDLPDGHRYSDLMPGNVWPREIPAFQAEIPGLYAALDDLGNRVLRAIAHYLDLDPDFFTPAVESGNSILRLLHYPPVPQDGPNIRAGAHEDINVITLLLGAEEAGLEVLDRDGRWLAINPPPVCLKLIAIFPPFAVIES